MAHQVSLVFSGMCAFKVSGVDGTVIMLSEEGAHRPTLVIPINFVDPDPAFTTWKPDLLGDIEQVFSGTSVFTQVGMWSLKKEELTGNDETAMTIDWPDKEKIIDFDKLQSGTKTHPIEDIKKGDANLSLFKFKGGKLSAASEGIVTISQEVTGDFERKIATRIRWTANLKDDVLTNQKGLTIKFRRDGSGVVSNLAPVTEDEGSTHVIHFYGILDVPKGTKKLTRVRNRDTTVFDCIRPVAVP